MKTIKDVPLFSLCSMRVGGTADFVIYAACAADVREAVRFFRLEDTSYKVIGAGTNLIFSDAGFRGGLIVFKSSYSAAFTVKNREQEAYGSNAGGVCFSCFTGVRLASVCAYAREQGLS
ncbi:MAG: hypothetical protein FWE62_04140, partial [Firmicutes bacterium]|nr:hypothetical protein [Bacillota bacterium]